MYGIYTDSPQLFSELALEVRLFSDERQIILLDAPTSEGFCIIHTSCEADGFYSKSILTIDGIEACSREVKLDVQYTDDIEFKKYKKRAAKQSIYDCLRSYYKKDVPWGSLTGIRPTKLFRQIANNQGLDNALRKFSADFFVSNEKLALSEEIYNVQCEIIKSVNAEDLNIYIGIPYCISKCAYCSFSSGLTSKNGDEEKRYVDALLKELKLIKPILDKYKIRSIYIGGGTPTALTDKDFERLLSAVTDMSINPIEFTVEAGRPDTITPQKLALIKSAGARRISVNAQTTSDKTLKIIGRSHTAKDFFDSFELAKSYGFDVINTDIIAGLPGETVNDLKNTINDVIRLNPENITVHTLAIKHGSKFAQINAKSFADSDEAERMISYAREATSSNGYIPYYLYRQKYMAGNLENVGYALPGKECVYNIDIMEETVSILALGAGGISKRLFNNGDRIERAANVKDIKNYIERTEEMALRKMDLFL